MTAKNLTQASHIIYHYKLCMQTEAMLAHNLIPMQIIIYKMGENSISISALSLKGLTAIFLITFTVQTNK